MDRIVVVGMGELGKVFAQGFLHAGSAVFPVLRGSNLDEVAAASGELLACVVAVGESDLDAVLASLPTAWRSRLVLMQNELRPAAWRRHSLADPTLVAVWFEKKAGRPLTPLLPTLAQGPLAPRVVAALVALGIPAEVVPSHERMLFELAAKNLYILTTNLAGLKVGGNVGALRSDHAALYTAVAREVMALERRAFGRDFPEAELLERLEAAILADPGHACAGRSAPSRLARTLTLARELGVDLPELRRIGEST